MDPNYANPEALNTLSSTINQTLIETGRFFRSRGSMQSRAQLKRTMPICREQFNLALDDLSEQIFMAKAFLERDYEAVKAKKAALEQPVTDVIMGDAEIKPDPDQQAEPEPLQIGLPKGPESEQEQQAKKEEEGDQIEAVKLESKPTSQEEERGEEGHDQGILKSIPAADQKPSQLENQQIYLTAASQQSGPALPGAAEPTEINFDSVLNDSAGGANDFDLNLDFGDDDLGNQNFLGASSGAVVSGGEGGQGGNEGQGDIMATDVPGLGDNNTFDMDLQQTSGIDSGIGILGQQGSGSGHGDEGMPGQSSFDDLFMDHDSTGEGNLLEGDDGLMNLSELDDSWFT